MYKYEILKVIENLVFDEFGEIHPSWLVPTWEKKPSYYFWSKTIDRKGTNSDSIWILQARLKLKKWNYKRHGSFSIQEKMKDFWFTVERVKNYT